MRFVFSVVAVLGLGIASVERAEAQYPIYAPQTYGHVVHEHDYHDHYDDHYHAPPAPQYYSGYAAVPVYPQYVPRVSYSPVYSGGGLGYVQPVVPQSPVYYSNNYYNQSAHTHHGWHLGHYLRGHH